jgi:pimeloyl-ACP methyl ester carboxylesterase
LFSADARDGTSLTESERNVRKGWCIVRLPYRGLLALGTGAAGAAAVNLMICRKAGPLRNKIGGSERLYRWRYGSVFYTMDGEGEPLLFIHGVSAGASSFEWRNNFTALSDRFRVFALDLLGFGLSDKPDVQYTPEMYAQLIADFILDVIGQPAGIAASSHGAAYAVQAASKHSLIINRLLLSCPTGIGEAEGGGPVEPVLDAALKVPVFGKSVYYGLTSRTAIGEFLKSRVYANPEAVTSEVVEQYYRAAHLPGASRAFKAFVSGKLNLGVREASPRSHSLWASSGVVRPA